MRNEEGWDKRRKLLKLYKRNKICFLFPCRFMFHLLNLLNMQKKMRFVFIFWFNHSLSVTIIINSGYLTLLYHRVYLCLILDLRKTKNKHTVHTLNCNRSFLLDTVSVLLFESNIILVSSTINFTSTFPYGPPLNLLKGSQCA